MSLAVQRLYLLIHGYIKRLNLNVHVMTEIIDIIFEFRFLKQIIINYNTIWNSEIYNDPFTTIIINSGVIISCHGWELNDNNKNGILYINCFKVINNGKITVNGKGFYGNNCFGYGKYKNKYYINGSSYGTQGFGSNNNTIYGNKTLKQIYCGSGSIISLNNKGGGGIIIILCYYFINNNIIESNGYIFNNISYGGSGGSIIITTDIFNNNGVITCIGSKKCKLIYNDIPVNIGFGGKGRIGIYYNNIYKIDYINPKPYLNNNYNAGVDIILNYFKYNDILINNIDSDEMNYNSNELNDQIFETNDFKKYCKINVYFKAKKIFNDAIIIKNTRFYIKIHYCKFNKKYDEIINKDNIKYRIRNCMNYNTLIKCELIYPNYNTNQIKKHIFLNDNFMPYQKVMVYDIHNKHINNAIIIKSTNEYIILHYINKDTKYDQTILNNNYTQYKNLLCI